MTHANAGYSSQESRSAAAATASREETPALQLLCSKGAGGSNDCIKVAAIVKERSELFEELPGRSLDTLGGFIFSGLDEPLDLFHLLQVAWMSIIMEINREFN